MTREEAYDTVENLRPKLGMRAAAKKVIDMIFDDYVPDNLRNCEGCSFEDYDMDQSPCCMCNRQVTIYDRYEVTHPADK